MRQQAREEEQKEAQQQLLRPPADSSSPVSMSASSCRPPAQVPVEVLKVQVATQVNEKYSIILYASHNAAGLSLLHLS